MKSVGSFDKHCDKCSETAQNYKRIPGLFKLEDEGDGIISLCSKTYHCFGDYSKIGTKGLNKAQSDLNKEIFLKVLENEQSDGGKNSFRTLKTRVYSMNSTDKAYHFSTLREGA